MSSFTGSLKTEWLPGGREWLLTDSFEFHSGEVDSGLFIRCEKGMRTDLASIPLVVRWLIPRVGPDAQGACIHDQGYRDGFAIIRTYIDGTAIERKVPVSRGMVDSLYYQAMRALDVSLWRREAIYRGLQMGGWVVWNKYREKGGMGTATTL